MWPTSELPICPIGKPTSLSDASRKDTCPRTFLYLLKVVFFENMFDIYI